MASISELRESRLQKLRLLEKAGKEIFPAKTNKDHDAISILAGFDVFCESKEQLIVAGRLLAIRAHGSAAFLDLFDGTGKLQLHLKEDVLGKESFDLFVNSIDIGDFIEAYGTAFKTKRGESTLEVTEWKLLTKSLLPLPEKWHGLVNDDERYRKRYLDLLQNNGLRDLFVKKSKFWDVTRTFLKEKGFLEVETPVLETTTGGAEARPFKTHHNDFDLEVYLRISVGELWQKRLMAAGFPKTFEIGKVYRNEGGSLEHLQEFTNMEFYWAYASYEDGMRLVEEMYKRIAIEVFGKTEFECRGHKFDLGKEWVRIDYREEVLRQTGVDVISASDDEIKSKLQELHIKYDGTNRERLTDTLWKYCRKNIAGPALLINHPKIIAPLAKAMHDNLELTESFQPIIAGSEVGRGYSELNDPIDQRNRFEHQQKLLEGGDEEAMMPDWEFVEMLEHGMPPTCGFGFGERLFAILAGVSMREAQLFPLMRPEQRTEVEDE